MKQKLSSDFTLRVLSVLIAVALWFYVVQIQSPDIERTVKGIPVVFTQQSTLEKRGLVLMNDTEHTIDIKIRGKRKYVMDVSAENTTVLADVSSIDGTGTHTVYTSIVLPYGNLEMINQHPSALTVEVDNLVSVKAEVTAEAVGEPKTEFVTGTLSVSPQQVTVKGPKSLVDGVSKVVAEVDAEDRDTDVETVVPLKFYGANGKEIKSSYISADVTEAEVRCEILKTKTVSLKPSFEGHNTEGVGEYRLDAGSEKEIKIAGPKDLIDKLSEVRTKPISASDINENGEAVTELELPQGVRSLEGNSFTFRFVPKNVPRD